MTIASSGAISLGPAAGTNRSITAEWGGSTPHTLSEYYNNGTAGVNLADPRAFAEVKTLSSSTGDISYYHIGDDGSTARTVVINNTGIGHFSNTGWLTDITNGSEEDTTAFGNMNFTNDSGSTDYFESPTADPNEQPWAGRYYYSYDQQSGVDQKFSYMMRVEDSSDGDWHYCRFFMGHYRCPTDGWGTCLPKHYSTVSTSSFDSSDHSYSKSKVLQIEWEGDFSGTVDTDDFYCDIVYFNASGTNDDRTEVILRVDRDLMSSYTAVSSIIAAVVVDADGYKWRFERGTEEAGDGPSSDDQYSMRHRRVPEYTLVSQTANTGWSDNQVYFTNKFATSFTMPFQNRSGYADIPEDGALAFSDYHGTTKIDAWTSTLTTGNTQGKFCFKSCSYWPIYGFLRYETFTYSNISYVRAIPATAVTSTFSSTEGSMTDTTFDPKSGAKILGLYWDESMMGTGILYFSIAGHHSTGDLQSISIGSTTFNFSGTTFSHEQTYQDVFPAAATTYPYTKWQWNGVSNPFPTTEGSTVSISIV